MIVLEAFAAHCQRMPLDKRPTVFAQHWDIWGKPVGEIGIPNVDPADLDINVFVSLVPWMMIPMIGLAAVVVDQDDRSLHVVRLGVSTEGISTESYRVHYSISDRGAMSFGEIAEVSVLPTMAQALADVVKGRAERIGWTKGYDFERSVIVARNMLS